MNKFKLYNHILNQWSRKDRLYQCTLYSSAVNLAYNCWIMLSLNDLDTICNKMIFDWKFVENYWAEWRIVTRYILNYIIENSINRNWKIPELKSFTLNKDVVKYINQEYAIILWISVNKKFTEDVKDWTINGINYFSFQWTDLKHYLNIINTNKRDYMIDNYAFNTHKREWIYSCNIKEVLKTIDQRTKYMFI